MKTGTEYTSKSYANYTPISEKKRKKLTKGLVGIRQLSEDDAQYLNRLYYNTCCNITLIIFIFVIYYGCVTAFLAALWQPMLEDSYWTGVAYCILFAVTVIILFILILIGTIKVNKLKKEEEARAKQEEEEAMRRGGSAIMGRHAA